MIISGGENIYPAEIERIIRKVSGIQAVAVVARADERWGSVPVAVIEVAEPEGESTNSATTPATVVEQVEHACAEQLARFKRPKAVFITDALPRNAMGKILSDKIKLPL